MKVKSGYCKACGENTALIANGTNHVVHLILTLLTAGLWAIIWILSAISPNTWICQKCGSKRIKSSRKTKIDREWEAMKPRKRAEKSAKKAAKA